MFNEKGEWVDEDPAVQQANDLALKRETMAIPRGDPRYQAALGRAQAGLVMVNLPTAGVDYHVPFGGRKGSSYGPREQGRYAAEFYTTVKTAYTQA